MHETYLGMTMLKDILTGGADAARRKSFSKNSSGADSAAQTAQTPPPPSVGRFLSVPGSERRHSHSSSDPVMAVEEGRTAETQGSDWSIWL